MFDFELGVDDSLLPMPLDEPFSSEIQDEAMGEDANYMVFGQYEVEHDVTLYNFKEGDLAVLEPVPAVCAFHGHANTKGLGHDFGSINPICNACSHFFGRACRRPGGPSTLRGERSQKRFAFLCSNGATAPE